MKVSPCHSPILPQSEPSLCPMSPLATGCASVSVWAEGGTQSRQSLRIKPRGTRRVRRALVVFTAEIPSRRRRLEEHGWPPSPEPSTRCSGATCWQPGAYVSLGAGPLRPSASAGTHAHAYKHTFHVPKNAYTYTESHACTHMPVQTWAQAYKHTDINNTICCTLICMPRYTPMGLQVHTYRCICMWVWPQTRPSLPTVLLQLPSSQPSPRERQKPMHPLPVYSPALRRQVVLTLWLKHQRPLTGPQPHLSTGLTCLHTASPHLWPLCYGQQVCGGRDVPQQHDKDSRTSVDSNFNMESGFPLSPIMR